MTTDSESKSAKPVSPAARMLMWMTAQSILDRWRWWWSVAVALGVFAAPIAWWTERIWWRLDPPWTWICGAAVTIAVGALIIWTIGVAPWLSAGDSRPRFQAPPRQHLNTLRLAVWTPTIVLVLCFVWLDVRPLTLRWIESGHLYIRWHPILLVPLPIVVICVVYGIIMSRLLRRRLRASTRRRGACFECGYFLRESGSCVCPECGAPAA